MIIWGVQHFPLKERNKTSLIPIVLRLHKSLNIMRLRINTDIQA